MTILAPKQPYKLTVPFVLNCCTRFTPWPSRGVFVRPVRFSG